MIDTPAVPPLAPYQFNPLDLNPMRKVLATEVDFERLRRDAPVHLMIAATRISDGKLRIFRNEDITYARRLSDAGVPTELHLHPGCPHAFEALVRTADVSQRAIGDRLRRLQSL